MIRLKKIFLILLFIGSNGYVMADQLATVHKRLTMDNVGTLVTVGGLNNNMEVNILPVPSNFIPSLATGVLTLGIDHETTKLYDNDFNISVTLTVETYNASNVYINTFPITLSVGYQPFSTESYKDQESYRFNGAYRYVYTVTSIVDDAGQNLPTLPENVYIDGDVYVDGSFDFASVINQDLNISSQSLDIDCQVNDDEITFSWGGLTSAIEYQLEWTFVNNYDGNGGIFSTSGVEFDFKHNSTRITTKALSYTIPLIFERGYLSYRVRAVGTDLTDPNTLLFGVWSSIEKGNVATSDFIEITAAKTHEQNKNWQLTTTFAEDGKKKEVINYADGSGRSRQSVTKINSDKNVVVAETIYDYQGRPAINVLPVPVKKDATCQNVGYEPILQFYPKFNVNIDLDSYTKEDFDKDGSGNCVISTEQMSTFNGASNYYSPLNPNKEAQQAFLPDGKQYPFTQVEYTPDNTGRIRRQSGVGEEFMLNTGHETRYMYGKPDQIFLDRLFGSEVGYAAHYKKNAVIDANNQASVSYLDQEGRVVATALAGEQNNGLLPLDSETGAQKQLTVDYFEKDANGVSSVNTVNVEGNGLEFTKEFIVITPSQYIITYDLNHDPFTDPCLREGICFECVYDLKIKLLDECGNYVMDNNPDLPEPQEIIIEVFAGKFTIVDGALQFITNDCNNNIAYTNNHYEFIADLGIGTYSISKTLTINQSAIQFYADAYADSVYNSCALTLNDFIDEEMAKIDTSSCYVTCESCVAALGTKDDFVASGAGTALQYDLLKKECLDPCSTPNLCDIKYEQMLVDVSKGGQYGEYLKPNGEVATDYHWLSVFSSVCYLPENLSVNNLNYELWRNPSYENEGSTYSYYFDEFGDSARVPVIIDGINYTPNVTSSSLVFYDEVNNISYTKPDNLAHISDFLDAWEASWAKSLVKYHPEYCYYLTCSGYANEDGNENSSNGFDNLLLNTKSFANAVSAGLIILDPLGSGQYVLNDIFTVSSTIPYDPFTTNAATAQYGLAIKNEVNIKITSAPPSSIPYSMLDVAAMIVNCQTSLSAATVPPGCTDFGANPANDDKIWNMFVTFYLSAKQTQQAAYEKAEALSPDGCYNGCIGNETYNLWTSGLMTPPYYPPALHNQPCFITNTLYKYKTKRFQTADDLPASSIEEISYQHYLQSGQCPNAFNFQRLLAELTADNISTDGLSLNDYPSFTSVILSNSNFDVSSPVPPANWGTVINGTQLTANVTVPAAPNFECTVTLDASPAGISPWDWADVIGFSGLEATGTSGGNYTFNIIVSVNNGTTISNHQISGTTCFDILNCQFQGVCDANDVAISVQNIMSMLAAQDDIDPANPDALITSPYELYGHTISNPDPLGPPLIQDPSRDYESQMNLSLLNLIQSTDTKLVWSYDVSTNTLSISPTAPASGLPRLDLHIISTSPTLPGTSQIAYFDNIQSENQHYFGMDAYDANGNLLATIHGEALLWDGTIYTPVEMGACELPAPLSCSEPEYFLKDDLGELLKNVLVSENYNIFSSPKITTLLQNYFPQVTVSSGAINTEGQLIINMPNAGTPQCTIELTIKENTVGLDFTQITDLGELIGTGETYQSSYYSFKVEALFNNGSTIYTDTIFGKSCIPLKICDLCVIPDDTNPDPHPDPDPLPCTSKICTVAESSPATFREYIQTVDSLNIALNLTATDTNYIQTVDYQTYFKKQYTTVAKTYKHFADGFNPELDDISFLKKPEMFTVDYGHFYNVEKEFDRYTKAVNKYNSRVVLPLDTMEAMEKLAFAQLKVAIHNKKYVSYLEQYPLQDTIAAKDAYTYLVDEQLIQASAPITDSCEILYNEYAQAFKLFSANTTSTCMVNLVLASYEDVVGNNLCCSAESRDIFRAYIATFDISLPDCPSNLPKIDVGNTVCDNVVIDPKECVRNFDLYLTLIDNYNHSTYALEHNNQLSIYPAKDYFLFEKMGLCVCLSKYLEYLTTYIKEPSGSTLPLPRPIYNFDECSTLPIEECTKQFFVFTGAINTYNNSNYANSTGYYLTNPYLTEEDFKNDRLCGDCLYKYVDYLLAFPFVAKVATSQPPLTITEFCKIAPPSECAQIYNNYVQAIADFNASPYAQQHGIVLSNAFSSAQELEDDPGLCNCVSSYIKYLLGFIGNVPLNIQTAAAEPQFKYIDEFCKIEPKSECDLAYKNYIDAVADYNAYVIQNDFDVQYNWPIIDNIYTSSSFTANGVCYCVESFVAYVNAVVAGYQIPHDVALTTEQIKAIRTKLDLGTHCLPPPCVLPVFTLDTVQPVYVPYENPCVEQMVNAAINNAGIAYEQWLQDIEAGFVQNYTQHCLKATEDLTATFDDKEYHYTLYYYDQAGNLVRTIPPEGLDMLNTTSSFDPVSTKINNDRTFKQRTIFTNHGLPTTYLYNSLNQLIKQDVPDHDKMDVYDFSLSTGLDLDVVVTSVQFVNGNKGYLTGYKEISGSGNFDRGYFYTTNDGGNSWTRINDVVASNLKKVQWLDNNIAYAIGDKGILIRTEDGGNNWDMVDLYSENVTVQLNDFHFDNDDVKGIIVGNNGTIIKKNNANYSNISTTVTGISVNDHITAVTMVGNKYVVTVDHVNTAGRNYGLIYKQDGAIASTWLELHKVRAPNLNDISFIDAQNAVAVSNTGLLLKTSNGGNDWFVVETNQRNNFLQVFFMDVTQGVAIIENTPGGAGKGEIYETYDGGSTWALLRETPSVAVEYTSFYTYRNAGTSARLIAIGAKTTGGNRIDRVILNPSNFGIIPVNVPTTLTAPLTAVWAEEVGTSIKAFVSSGTNLYYSNNIAGSSATWRDYSVAPSSLGAATNITKIEAKYFTPSDPTYLDVVGTLLTDNNNFYGFKIGKTLTGYITDPSDPLVQIPVYDNAISDGTTPVPSPSSPTLIAPDVKELALKNGGDKVYAYQTSTNNIFTVDLISATIPNGTTTVTTAPVGIFNSLSINFTNNHILLSSLTGKIKKYDGSAWANQTKKVRPYLMNDLKLMATTNELLSVGENGTLLSTTATPIDASTVFTLVTNPNMENWNAIAEYPGNLAVICGDNGVINKIDPMAAHTLTALPSGTIQHLNDVAVDNTKIYVAGNNGAVLYTDDIINAFQPVAGNGGVSFSGVSVNTNGIAAYVGENSNVYLGAATTMYKIKQVFTPKLVKAHFTDAANGYVVGADYTVRQTQNGATSFGIVLPDVGFASGVPVLNSVFTRSSTEAYLTGNKKYIAKTTGLMASSVGIIQPNTTDVPANFNYNDITFTSPSVGFIVGGKDPVGVALTTTNSGGTWDKLTGPDPFNQLNAVFGFKRNNTFVAVGKEATMVRFNGVDVVVDDISGLFTSAPPLPNLHDVFFHDDKLGYAVGKNGTIIKTTAETTFDPETGVLINPVWAKKDITETFLGLTNPNKKEIYTIDFADRYNGFIGGEYSIGIPSMPKGYARLLHDESELFSTYFYYDRLGRLIVSQNTKQFNTITPLPKRFSYTLYDQLGRIKEVGEKDENTSLAFSTIFGADVSGHYNPNTIDDTKLLAWINGDGLRKQVTKTYYDFDAITHGIVDIMDFPTDFEQQNLRKRVASVTYEDVLDNDNETYQFATHYNYDIHGNVKSLLHDNPTLSTLHSSLNTQRYKRLDYTYDLISGNVLLVSYQNGQPDAWHHRYEYDSDNRITHAKTSTVPTPLESDWELDAHYLYYHHGPLARTELGEHTVQGIDYAYTLQGWLKGVNSESLYADRDMGKDGNNVVGNSNKFFAKDAFGFSLGYHNSDYTPIDGSATFLADKTGSNLLASTSNLYNGNISSMVTTIVPPTLNSGGTVTYAPAPQGTAYKYDRLNRLKSSQAWQDINAVGNVWATGNGSTYAGMYENNFNYDANGNILTQGRKDATGTYIDTLTYQYAVNDNGRKVQNRLYHVNDPYNYNIEDIDDMSTFNDNVETINDGITNNYKYDEIGNLTKDTQEEIEEIKWRVDGKIAEIKRGSGSNKQNLVFNYDTQGNRIAKHLYLYGSSNEYLWEKSTYYVRDAQGNPMAVYDLIASGSSGLSYKVAERDIYGSSRIGLNTTPVEMIGATPPTDIYAHILGDKNYQLENHLGNILAVVTDKKLPIDDGNGNVAYYLPHVISSQDYSAFGVLLEDRKFASESYRYGFNGKEKDDEVKGAGNQYDYGFRIYDPRLGRFLSVDPMFREFPYYTPYQFAGNKPIWAIDLDGLEEKKTNGGNDKELEDVGGGLSLGKGSKKKGPPPANGDVQINDLPKAGNVGDFVGGVIDKLETGDKISSETLKDFIKPSKTKSGEKEVGEILSLIDGVIAKKEGSRLELKIKIPDGKPIEKTLDLQGTKIKLTLTNKSRVILEKQDDGSIKIKVRDVALLKVGKIVDIPLPESAASISIKGDKLDVNVLGITVKEGQKIALPKTLKTN